jgi:hypothetical protein
LHRIPRACRKNSVLFPYKLREAGTHPALVQEAAGSEGDQSTVWDAPLPPGGLGGSDVHVFDSTEPRFSRWRARI